MKKIRYDLALIALALLAAGLLWRLTRPGVDGAAVAVVRGGAEIGRYPLDEDRTVTIGGEAYNVLEIRDGRAAVVEANCGDHTCVRTGAVSREGEAIICLPHKLEIRVVGGAPAGADIIAQ